jgi:DNA-binding winged helix-turn-helix (wHTH) protein
VTTTNTFYQAILTLRNALADVGLPRDTVKTISRRGLALNENTQVEAITHPQSGLPATGYRGLRAPKDNCSRASTNDAGTLVVHYI